MKINLLFSIAVITALNLSSCKKTTASYADVKANAAISSNISQDSIYKGSQVKVFGGKAWVWIKFDSVGKPRQLAITLTNTVFTTVPFDTTLEEQEIVIPAPSQANITAFHDFAIDWSPQGHLPQGIYDLPLFDFHFYTISEAERQAIFTDSNYYQRFRTYPPKKYVPANYGLVNAGGIPGGGCITGVHLYDTTASEFHGQTFTQTFVYGSYNGKVDFYDPMMTLNFLQSTQGFQRSIPQPAKFMINGYYPTKMEVVKHATSTDVILEGFKLRAAQ
jgi:hypothetical protein